MITDRIINNYHDEASRFVQLLTMINLNVSVGRTDNNLNGSVNNSAGCGRFYLIPEDFVPIVQDVVDTHPGLTFLKEAAEFHSRYVHTVTLPIIIIRSGIISNVSFVCVLNRWSPGFITMSTDRGQARSL